MIIVDNERLFHSCLSQCVDEYFFFLSLYLFSFIRILLFYYLKMKMEADRERKSEHLSQIAALKELKCILLYDILFRFVNLSTIFQRFIVNKTFL